MQKERATEEIQHRVSVFPRTKNGESRFKRTLTDLEPAAQPIKESAQKLQKRQGTPNPIPKAVSNPWERYQKSFKINQAGPGYVVHANNATFAEGIIKEVKVPRSELSKIITSPHRNLVHLQEALYHDETVFLVYEVMDISLGQIFNSPLGRLQLFEVAAFTHEVLTGIKHIHKTLDISHGDLNSDCILLSVTGSIKIGTTQCKKKKAYES
jgi:serine/threonine protein kinase